MIYLTGDIHGYCTIEKLVNNKHEKKISQGDYLIVCGDFGLPFLPTDTFPENDLTDEKLIYSREQYLKWIDWLSKRPYTVLFVDGNHDNYRYWSVQEETEWMGGKINVHPDVPNVFHLKRGEFYTIEESTFFTMGGARSCDIERRTKGFSWWEEEIPSEVEYQHGIKNLEDHNYQVDYIITHAMSEADYCCLFNKQSSIDPTEQMLSQIQKRVKYKYWYCGHYHIDLDSPERKLRIVYSDIAKLGEPKPKPSIGKRALKKVEIKCKYGIRKSFERLTGKTL